MNGVIWWGGKLIPIEKFSEALLEHNKEREEDKEPPPLKKPYENIRHKDLWKECKSP